MLNRSPAPQAQRCPHLAVPCSDLEQGARCATTSPPPPLLPPRAEPCPVFTVLPLWLRSKKKIPAGKRELRKSGNYCWGGEEKGESAGK